MCETDSDKPRGVFSADVVSNRNVCPEHFLCRLRIEGRFPSTRAGQFVQVECRPAGEAPPPNGVDWVEGIPPVLGQPEFVENRPLLRRPISLAGRRDVPGGAELELIYRAVGAGTRYLSTLAPGEAVSLIGPLGNAFPISPTKKRAALVGGGVGIPPMLYLAETLSALVRRFKV